MEHLWNGGTIGTMTLKNRIIMTAIHTGFSIEKETEFLRRRILGGASAVTAVMGVSDQGAYHNMEVIGDSMLDKLEHMAEAIHQAEGRLIVQLFHAGRNAEQGLLANKNAIPVAPSPIPSPIYKSNPNELTKIEIQAIIDSFGLAAKRCKMAGVDAVEISCSAGYLLSQFFSPRTNHREDEYGGNLESRMLFPLKVVKSVREQVGKAFPVILRVSASDMLGGYGIEDTITLVKTAEPLLNGVNVTGGWHESPIPQISMYLPEGGFAFLAKAIRQQINIPVIGCNRINNRETAEEVLDGGYADFVGCARAFLVDPDFAKKMKLEIPYRRCIGCNKGCIEQVLKMKEASCAFNPTVGVELDHLQKENKSLIGRKTLVIGAGPAGIQAAIQCALKGDRVTLCTKDPEIGGLMHGASKIPRKGAIQYNIEAMLFELQTCNVEIKTATLVDSAYVEQMKPDYIVVATGGEPFVPPIKGVNQKHVYTADAILNQNEKTLDLLEQKNILIIGGGAVGLEIAQYLINKMKLSETGRRFFMMQGEEEIRKQIIPSSPFTVVELSGRLGTGLSGLRRDMIKELEQSGVKFFKSTKVVEILENRVLLQGKKEEFEHPADVIVLAAGYQTSGKALVNWLTEVRAYQFDVIGDAAEIGTIGSALKSGSEIGMK